MSATVSNLFPAKIKRQIAKMPNTTQIVIAQRVKADRPVLVYEEAIAALAECRSIDDAKYFSDQADALAAYAKIFKDKKLQAEAKRVKYHSLRRMAQIAEKLRPTIRAGQPGGRGRSPGASSLLKEHGIEANLVAKALNLSRVPQSEFERAVNRPTPPALTKLTRLGVGRGLHSHSMRSDAYAVLVGSSSAGHDTGLGAAGRLFRRPDLKDLARSVTLEEAKKIRELMLEIHEGLDVLDQYMPKEGK